MILAEVIGNVVATVKHPSYQGIKVLVVVPLDTSLKPCGSSFLAMDNIQAGEGDVVLVAREGNTARQILGNKEAPYHSVVCGIVDHVDLSD
ncbi:MAG: hypothetical protein A2284_13770 [Deltaproteobacteria bacterium RIFOXYA12_FULL_61_11]|nr:MAG: hypothetical protein A2284_13770 [Deltaproteobacteria bacterium RIFOXYA12_FULL_61_11]